ncbi:MAG: amino acid permease [Acidobacteria bacterium]|nr:amino acid permease [Acidobacteriota bacterium]
MTKLARTLGFRDLLFIVIGSVIGSGIFRSPGTVLSQVEGVVAMALIVWLVGGVVSLLGALTYGELSATNPAAGGLYIFIRDGFGRFPAFLFGWTFFTVITSGSVAALAVVFTEYCGQLVPLTKWMANTITVASIAVMTFVNVIGTRRSANLNNLTTIIKVLALLAMSAALMWFGRNYDATSAAMMPKHLDGHLASGFGLAMIAVLWAYEGWQYATFSAGEAISPQRNFPRAFLLGMLILIGIYLLANIAYFVALGPAAAAKADSIAATAVGTILGAKTAKLVALAVMVSTFSAANSTFLTAPRIYYAMAYDGLFFQKFAEVHKRFGTPAVAVIASGVWAAILAVSGTFEQLTTYVVFIGWAFYALAAASIFAYRKHYPAATRSYSVPGYPLTPILFLLAAAALVINTVATQFMQSLIGLGIVALGVPVYFIWRARLQKAEAKMANKPASTL